MDAAESRRFWICPTARAVAQKASALFGTLVAQAVAERHVCNIALAGGSTPRMLYSALAESVGDFSVPWGSVNVFFSDERDVPHDHVDSNYHTAQRTLLDFVPIPPQQIHPMPADADDLVTAAATYEQTIRRTVPAGPEGIPRFDLILLGVGADGHTASLFPGSEALEEREALVVSPHVRNLGRYRMTFTFPLINAARAVMMLITQRDKTDVVSTMFGASAQSIPAGRVQPTDGVHLVLLDSAAAQKLKPALRSLAN